MRDDTNLRRVFKSDLSSMQLCDFSDEGETEAGALLPGIRPGERVKPLENPVHRVVWNARATVSYFDLTVVC